MSIAIFFVVLGVGFDISARQEHAKQKAKLAFYF